MVDEKPRVAAYLIVTLCFALLLTMGQLLLGPGADAVGKAYVDIPDKTLRACFNTAINDYQSQFDRVHHRKGYEDQITLEELEVLTDLVCYAPVQNLFGVQLAHNLERVSFGYSDGGRAMVSAPGMPDLSPLKDLKSLVGLRLTNVQLRNLDTLGKLDRLAWLDISNNQVEDLSPIAALESLTDLDASQNQIRDLTPLANLSRLKKLNLSENEVSDLSPLKGLTALDTINLYDNHVADLSPLGKLLNGRMVSSLAELNVQNQTAKMPPLKVGKPVPNPIRDMDGNAVDFNDWAWRDGPGFLADNTESIEALQPGKVTFDWSEYGGKFSGSVTTKALPGPPWATIWICIGGVAGASAIFALWFLWYRSKRRRFLWSITSRSRL